MAHTHDSATDLSTATLWDSSTQGFISKFGPKDEDWELSDPPHGELDDYEIKMRLDRLQK